MEKRESFFKEYSNTWKRENFQDGKRKYVNNGSEILHKSMKIVCELISVITQPWTHVP